MQIVSCVCRKSCFSLCSGKQHGQHYPEACSCGEIGNYGNQLKANRTALIQTLYNLKIKMMSSFKRNEAWFQANICINFAFVQNNTIIQYILYMQICNICKYVT